ncbi:CvpA family protein [Dyella sp. A6]|uniref:CvpA family protein n=1 Tax=Dyella aluminiiresistens TaxID=3069105 RepID=UPI002E7A8FCC|nr:CvpA family protein [Dyella sp. A6]
MSWVDYIILVVLGMSVLVGLLRGLVSEVLALATWIAAFWVAWTFGPDVSARLEHHIDEPSIRLVAGYALCFVSVLVLGALVRFVIHRLVEGTGLSGTDRLLGMLFGFARGVLLVSLMVFLMGFTNATNDTWWTHSALLPQFQGVATWLGGQLPANVRQHLHPVRIPSHLPTLPSTLPAGLQPAHGESAASPPLSMPVAATRPAATANSSR